MKYNQRSLTTKPASSLDCSTHLIMKKQLWVLCKNKQEGNKILGILNDYHIDIKCEPNKSNFPIVVGADTKSATRCTSVSCCGVYVSSGRKMLTLEEFKKQYEE